MSNLRRFWHMCMQWLLGSLFPSHKRAWGRGYYNNVHTIYYKYKKTIIISRDGGAKSTQTRVVE